MAKNNKTRKQKILADHRHVVYHLESSASQVKYSLDKKADSHVNSPVSSNSATYAYVAHDLKKTGLITAIILSAQIIIFLFLHRI